MSTLSTCDFVGVEGCSDCPRDLRCPRVGQAAVDACKILVANLVIVGALTWAHHLGYTACPCDQGPRGDEWWPGRHETPDEVADRRWNDDQHDYVENDGVCRDCNNRLDWYLHLTEAEQAAEDEAFSRYMADETRDTKPLHAALAVLRKERRAARGLPPLEEDL